MTEQWFEFGHFVFDRERKLLLKDGMPVAIGQRALALLEVLLAAQGRTVPKLDLLEAAWRSANVEESNLSVQIAALRKRLGRTRNGGDWIARPAHNPARRIKNAYSPRIVYIVRYIFSSNLYLTQTRSAVNHGNHHPAVQRLCEVIAAAADQVDARADAVGDGRKAVDCGVNRNVSARRLRVHKCCKRVSG